VQIMYMHSVAEPSPWRFDHALNAQGHTVVQHPVASPIAIRALSGLDAAIIDSATGDAFDACRELRRLSDIPILMIGGDKDEVHVITGLTVGTAEGLVVTSAQ
jgi:DNA-binding response OmpR family regulator